MRHGHPDCMQDGGEGFRAFGQLGEAVLHKAIPNNQPERNGSPASYRSSIYEPKAVAQSLFQWFVNDIHVQLLPFLKSRCGSDRAKKTAGSTYYIMTL